jgi:glycine dehydrogenase subunit 1
MPFIPHTSTDVREMLDTIGIQDIEQLFDEVPDELVYRPAQGVEKPGKSEMEATALMEERAKQDQGGVCFIGAGAYDHFVPAAVHRIATRSEFYTAYTPYQAEASQGTLQLLYEYQSMMAALMAMDYSNASLYDGASGLAEAVLMAVRANRKSKSKRILMPRSVHPAWRKTVHTIVRNQGVELIELGLGQDGVVDPQELERFQGEDIAALVIPQPNFLGRLEACDQLTDWAHQQAALVIGAVNPVASALLAPPGEWGAQGADIACGEGQPLGLPLSSGGPYFGFLCCRDKLVRQMPGRIIGRTLDLEGKPGFTLTLQAREQHIRRSKATSNICTNQGLMVTAATIYLALEGAQGLERKALACHHNTARLKEALCAIDGVEPLFTGESFHECAIRLPLPPSQLLDGLAAHGILGGLDLARDYPELGNALLICATERRTQRQIDAYAEKLERLIQARTTRGCGLRPDSL